MRASIPRESKHCNTDEISVLAAEEHGGGGGGGHSQTKCATHPCSSNSEMDPKWRITAHQICTPKWRHTCKT